MPKMKTKSSAKKRFKLTARGKVLHAAAGHRHCLEHKGAKRGRRLRQTRTVDQSNVRQIKRMLIG